jgi:hypothetical protein
VRITNTGNVGIGDTNPQRKLTVRADSDSAFTAQALYNANTTNDNGTVFSFRSDTTGTGATSFQEFGGIVVNYTEHDHATRKGKMSLFTINNGNYVTALTLNPNGDVGIGTASPTQKLDVIGNAKFGNHIIGTNIRTASRGEFFLNSESVDTVSEMFFGYGTGYTENNIRWGISDRGVTTGTLEFYRGPANGGFSSVMTLTKDLNVGIGTSTPSRKFQVAADGTEQILLTGSTDTNKQLIFTYDTVNDFASIAAVHQQVAYRTLALNPNGGNVGVGTTNAPQKFSVNNGNINISGGFLYFNNGDVEIGRVTTGSGAGAYFKTWTGAALTEKMRINGDGRVGIGTNGPLSIFHIKDAVPEVKLEAGVTSDSGTIRYNSTSKSIEFIFA